MNNVKIEIGPFIVEPGVKKHGYIKLSRSSAGFPIDIPITIVNGVEPGPVLVVNAAMHGTETLGTIAISQFYRALTPQQLKGTFIGVPILNMWAFEAEHRVPTLFDSFDLERLFPGDDSGSISNRLASAFMKKIVRLADCLIDFHGQDRFWHPTNAIIVPLPKPQGNIESNVYQHCIAAAQAFGVRQIWRLNKPGSVTETIITEKGIPAISPEFGGVTDYHRITDYVNQAVQGITNVCTWLGMLDGIVPPRNFKTCICDLHPVRNRFGGIWATSFEPEAEVIEGTVIGTISDPITAAILEEIRAPFSGVITNLWCQPVIKPAVLALGMGKVVEYV